MPFVTESDITAIVNTIFEGALLVARDNNLMEPLVLGFNDRTGLAPRSVPQYGSATINTIGETDDLVSQAFTPSVLSTLTPAEAGGQFFLTDSRVETDLNPVRQDASQELGMAMAQKMEEDILGDFANLSGGTVGAAGTVITWGHFFAMLSQLRAQHAPQPYYCVMHPYQWHQLAKSVSVAGGAQTNAPDFQNAVMQRWFVQQAGPVSIFNSANISINGSGDADCAMFSRQAIALDARRAPRLEPQRDSSRRGWELNMTAVYAHGVYRPAFGIRGIFDCATPTS